MAAGERTLKVKVDGDSRGLDKAARRSATAVGDFDKRVRGAGKSAGKSEKDVDRLNRRLGGMGRTAGLAAIGITAAAAAWIGATGASLQNIERLQAQTDTVVKSMGAVWTNTADIVAFGDRIEKLSGIEQENVQEGQNLLLTYGNVTNQVGKGNNVFDQASQLMVDLSVATGKAMPEAANLLGKALNDPVKGLTALTRVGIQFTEQQRLQIAALVDAGDVMGAQKIILAELQKQFGGSAAAFGETTAGQVAKLQNEFGALSEELLADLLPALNNVLDVARDVIAWVKENESLVTNLAIGLGGLAAAYLAVQGSIKLVNGAQAAFNVVSAVSKGNVDGLTGAFSNMSRVARIASISMGAVGVIASVIGTAMAIFGGQSKEAAAHQEELATQGRAVADAIAEQNGFIDENVRAMVAKNLEEKTALENASRIGISSDALVSAVLREGDSYDQVRDKLREYVSAGINGSDEDKRRAAIAFALIGVLDNQSGAIEDGIDAREREQDASGQSTSATETNTTAVQANVDAINAQINALREAAGQVLGVREAQNQYYESLQAATEAIKENGVTLDVTTEKGRNNRSALDDIAKSTLDLVEAQGKNGESTSTLAASMTNGRAEFIRTAQQMGLNKRQAEALANSLGLIPNKVRTDVEVRQAAAEQAVRSFLKRLSTIPAEKLITLRVSTSGSGHLLAGQATGGPVLPGRSYVVGERGPEIFRAPNTGGHIVPNHELMAGGDVKVFVTIDGQQLQGRIDRTVRENNRTIRRGATAGTGAGR